MTETSQSLIEMRLAHVRQQMHAHGLDALLVPVSDPYFSEELNERWKHVKFLSGFDSSLGFMVITKDKAALICEGIYIEQARAHVTREGLSDLIEVVYADRQNSLEACAGQWLCDTHLPQGAKVGYDPMLHSSAEVRELREQLNAQQMSLVPAAQNLVMQVLQQQQPQLCEVDESLQAYVLDERFTGESCQQRIGKVAQAMAALTPSPDVLLLAPPASLCWMLNLRGRDAADAPLPHMRGWVDKSGQVSVFYDRTRMSDALIEQLEQTHPPVNILPESQMGAALQSLAASGRTMLIPRGSVPEWFERTIEDSRTAAGLAAQGGIITQGDPVAHLKAVKTANEMMGMRHAHLQDGIAMVKFLHWLDEQKTHPETLSEAIIEQKIHEFRAQRPGFVQESFATIAAAGANSAYLHYSDASPEPFTPDTTHLLLDSGAHYLDPYSVAEGAPLLCGSTDITRTVRLAAVRPEPLVAAYTAAMKAHIALASHRFEEGTPGHTLDALARDQITSVPEYAAREREQHPERKTLYGYECSTGHGIGFFGDLHEFPPRLSSPGRWTDVGLKPRMIFSNEPGYYDAQDGVGVRIENVVAVQKGRDGLCELENLTLAPFDVSLLDFSRMNAQEITWLNNYHAQVREALMPHLEPEEQQWLAQATRPVGTWQQRTQNSNEPEQGQSR